jgi:glycosyltransferase involved in cell wall biosynthesis/GT2 family glycosyltransferase
LDSLLCQTTPFSRIVVVDDKSADDTRAIADEYSARHETIEVCSVRFGDPGTSRNFGASRYPHANFYLFVDADNILNAEMHARLLAAFEVDGANYLGVAYPDLWQFEDAAPLSNARRLAEIRGFDINELRAKNLADTCALVRREAFEQSRGWMTGAQVCEDWCLWLEIARLGWRMQHVPQAHFYYRKHGDSRIAGARLTDQIRDLARTLKVAVITPFAGRGWALDAYFESLAALDWPRENLHLVAVDNSGDAAFGDLLYEKLRGYSHTVVTVPARAVDEIPAAELAGAANLRIENGYAISSQVARLYGLARAAMPTGADLVWTLEDDVCPSPDALQILARGLYQYAPHLPRIGAVCGLLKSRFDGKVMVYQRDENDGMQCANLEQEYSPIDGSGFYCTLWHRSAFEVPAFRPCPELGKISPPCYDFAAYGDVQRAGFRVLAARDVKCLHLQENAPPLTIDAPQIEVKESRLRCGVLTPTLLLGGAERWICNLLDYTDASQIDWRGVVSLERQPHSPLMRAELNAPFLTGIEGVEKLRDECDVMVCWGVAEADTLFPKDSCKRIAVSHGVGAWASHTLQNTEAFEGLAAVSRVAISSFHFAQQPRVKAILNCVDDRRLVGTESRDEWRAARGLAKHQKIIAWVGRLSEDKSPLAMIDALENLPGKWHGVMAGEGYWEEYVREQANERVPGRITFLGSKANIGDVLRGADYFLLATPGEGCSLAILEAAWGQTPIISTPVGWLLERPTMARLVPIYPTGDELAQAFLEDEREEDARRRRIENAQSVVKSECAPAVFGRNWTDYILKTAEKL